MKKQKMMRQLPFTKLNTTDANMTMVKHHLVFEQRPYGEGKCHIMQYCEEEDCF